LERFDLILILNMSTRFTNVIFDLDGTLVDSAPAILTTFQGVLDKNGLTSKVTLDERLIGPPLPFALAKITGIEDASIIDGLINDFKSVYDDQGVAATRCYPEIEQQLAIMHARGLRLHVATNKRLLPTKRILERLDLLRYFKEVYAIDRRTPPYASKTEMMGSLLADAGLPHGQSCYVGDRSEDAAAAKVNGLPFFLATWGYSDFETPQKEWRVLSSPEIMADILMDFDWI
jgi:phosphoglycolate phosphatase